MKKDFKVMCFLPHHPNDPLLCESVNRKITYKTMCCGISSKLFLYQDLTKLGS